MHSESTTDLLIIKLNLNRCKSNKENVVLLKTGSLNSIYRSRVSNMIKTKQSLENVYDFNVMRVYRLSTIDQYVQSKLDKKFISSKHRIQMYEKAIQAENQQNWFSY